VNSEHCQVTND